MLDAQARLLLSRQPPMKWQSSAKRSSVEHSVMMAFSAGGRWLATCSALNPPQEMPIIPTAPLHQG